MFVKPCAASLRTAEDSMLADCEPIDLVEVSHNVNMPLHRPGFKALVDSAAGLGNHDPLL